MTNGRASSPPSPDIDPLGAPPEGSLTFVGAGPCDPELLTLAGAKALRSANLVVVDDNAQCRVIDQLELPHEPEILTAAEDETEQLLSAARAGRDVVRLVSGDLFFDGCVSPLAAAISDPGIRVQVIPGVSLFTASVDYVGLCCQAWSFVDASCTVPLTWPSADLVVAKTTGGMFADLASSCDRPADEPVLVVSRLASRSQRSQLTTWSALSSIEAEGPVFLLAGQPLAKRAELDWFESKPLFDWRVLVPVAKDQGGVVSARLASYGALPHEVPTMSIEPPRTEQQMEKAVRGLVDGRYKWIVFTSPHAVEGVRARFIEYGLDARAMSGIEIAAVGSQTARALSEWGLRPDLMPMGQQTTANLTATFPAFDDLLDPINRVLVPRAEISTDQLVAGLSGIGWEVEDVTAYRTVRAAPPPAETREAIKTGLFDAVVFASSSTVRNLIGIAGKPHNNMVVVAIGAATAAACADHGLRVDAVAPEPTAKSLADTLARFAAERRAGQLERGEPLTKPSQRRRRRRKNAAADTAKVKV